MKSIVTTLFFLLIAFTLQSQEAAKDTKIKKSKAISLKENLVVGPRSYVDAHNNLFSIWETKKYLYAKYTDPDLNVIKSARIPWNDKKVNIRGIFATDDALYILVFKFNRKVKKLEYYVYSTGKERLVFKRQLLASIPFDERENTRTFYGIGSEVYDDDALGKYFISPNGKYVALSVDIKNQDSEVHSVFLFDDQMNLVFNTKFTRALKDRHFALEEIAIDEESGIVYLLGKARTLEAREKKDGGKYVYELFKITKDAQTSVTLSAKENYIGTLKLLINGGDVICTGFYSEMSDYRFKGIAYYKINKADLSTTEGVFSPFSNQFLIDKYGSQKNNELQNLSFRSLAFNARGELVMNAEEFKIHEQQAMRPDGSWSSRVIKTYIYKDIVILKLSPTGQLEWARNINKKQSEKNSWTLSYSSAFKENMTYIFINASDKISQLSNDRIKFKEGSTKKPNLFVIKVADDGSFTYDMLGSFKDIDYRIPVKYGISSINNDFMYFPARGKKEIKFFKVTF